ncbi:MAG: GNAT family N-acetyltransferase [Actinobacteria bacterium]|nr:GNAT family N-acetyltransferase [Actinomycetota bacterium]MCG2819043.1 GNAT family N-acetyltransferase [Actinomycetes bacterium]MBU4178691.1 GNAT family N-acetyltransferase [Actinomycetota bacterium]MBU4219715.1 GNAT family N-acetyltransferase [Actinomycetota bacterium]MBU4357676.1 GNAT family N-acetyltransferase [Actinomycetota bacterium]
MVEIRKGTLADEEDVAVLIRELGQELGITGDINPVSWYSTLRKMLASPEWTFLLAEEGKKNVGLLILLILPSLYHGGNTAAITELIVSEAFRGKGIGALLVEESKRIGRSMGCEELDVSVEVDNESAIGFYEKLGFKKKHADYGMEI